MIIGIHGRAGSGKDTVADYLVQHYGFRKDSLAAPLKRCVQDIFGISDAVMNDRGLREAALADWPDWTPRRLLQFVGTELFRDQIDPDIWVKSLCKRLLARPTGVDWVIPDVRFVNEDRVLRRVFGASYRLLHIARPGYRGAPSGILNHASEAESPTADGCIRNTGTLEELYSFVDAFMPPC